jgi:hypothetical protein
MPFLIKDSDLDMLLYKLFKPNSRNYKVATNFYNRTVNIFFRSQPLRTVHMPKAASQQQYAHANTRGGGDMTRSASEQEFLRSAGLPRSEPWQPFDPNQTGFVCSEHQEPEPGCFSASI